MTKGSIELLALVVVAIIFGRFLIWLLKFLLELPR